MSATKNYTKEGFKKLKDELEYLTKVRMEEIKDAIAEAKSHGDLSENAEYKIAKQEKNANDRRIRFLTNMINTAVIVKVEGDENTVGLFDKVTVYVEEDDCEEVYHIVTTMRAEIFDNRISNESPMGKALLGKKLGDKVTIEVNPTYSYDVVIRKIEKGIDDENISIR